MTWRHGSKVRLNSRFCFVRVKTMHDDGVSVADREPLWLVAEWPDGEDAPTKYTLTTLPRRMSRKQIVRLFKERWRTERMYEDLKGELGLDHFEGRSFTGWHHHVSVVLCCYAFVVSEALRFSPLGRRESSRPCDLRRGLNVTSSTPSSQSGSTEPSGYYSSSISLPVYRVSSTSPVSQ